VSAHVSPAVYVQGLGPVAISKAVMGHYVRMWLLLSKRLVLCRCWEA